MTTNNKKTIELEDLIAETEQKILNNEYYEDVEVPYKDAIIKVRIQPISQAEFTAITKNKAIINNTGFYGAILQKCVLNKHDNKRFTLEQINKLFTGGLTITLGLKCLEISGIPVDKKQGKNQINF